LSYRCLRRRNQIQPQRDDAILASPPFFLRYDSQSVSVFDFESLQELEALLERALQDAYGIFDVKLSVGEPDVDADPFEDHEAELSITYLKAPLPKKAHKEISSSLTRPTRPPSFWDRLRGETPIRLAEHSEEGEHAEVDEQEYTYTFSNVIVNSLKDGALLAIRLIDNDGTLILRNIALKRALERSLARAEPSVQPSTK